MTNELTNPPTSPQPTSHIGRFQFNLKQMFAALLVGCLVLAMYTWIGMRATTLIVVLVAWIVGFQMGFRSKRFSGVEFLVFTVMLGIIVALVLPPIHSAGTGGRLEMCGGHLKQIGLALRAYHDQYGTFPPASIPDKDGNPMHSWRVLLLPYLDRLDLYEAYDFNEPWNGPNNSKLHSSMPKIFQCPSETISAPGMTSYVAIVGREAAWPEVGARKLDDFLDGPGNTLLVVESHNSGICWLEPRDLHLDQMAPTINSKSGQGISSAHSGGALVVRADGSIFFLSEKLTAKELRALITPASKDKQDLPAK